MSDEAKRSSAGNELPGPPSWPYSNANTKANNIIWRLCRGVAPQQIYDALDSEGLAIVEKTAPAQAAPIRLAAALRAIIDANSDFRAGMPKDWEGDPLQDAINEAVKLLATESAPPQAAREAVIEECAKIAEGSAPIARGNFFEARRRQTATIAAAIRSLSRPQRPEGK